MTYALLPCPIAKFKRASTLQTVFRIISIPTCFQCIGSYQNSRPTSGKLASRIGVGVEAVKCQIFLQFKLSHIFVPECRNTVSTPIYTSVKKEQWLGVCCKEACVRPTVAVYIAVELPAKHIPCRACWILCTSTAKPRVRRIGT